MSRRAKLGASVLAILAVALCCGVSQATSITVNGTTVFSDNSESSTLGAAPGADDPNPGTWSNFGGTGTVMTRTGAVAGGPTAAAEGNNYLQFQNGAVLNAVMDGGAVTVANNDIHAEFSLFSPAAAGNGPAFGFVDSAGGFGAWLFNGDPTWTHSPTNKIYYLNASQTAYVDTGLTTSGAWDKVALDWNHNTSVCTLTVNGSSATVDMASANVASFNFTENDSAANFSIDAYAVPEPSSLALLTGALLGLMAYAWRRRKA